MNVPGEAEQESADDFDAFELPVASGIGREDVGVIVEPLDLFTVEMEDEGARFGGVSLGTAPEGPPRGRGRIEFAEEVADGVEEIGFPLRGYSLGTHK